MNGAAPRTGESPLRALVVDDEKLARDELCYQLGQDEDVEVIGQAANGVEALDALNEHDPDIVFLDVQMPGLSGFEVARQLLEQGADPPMVVFVTAYDRHAIEAFEVNAVDYLLKPVDPARLRQALARARRRLGAGRDGKAPDLNDQIEQLARLVTGGRPAKRDQVAVKVGERFLLVQAEDIVFASLADESITIVTGQVTGTSNFRTLDDLQARLDPATFWRVHRSHLVNINQVKENRPVVQQELYPSDEGHEGDGNTGQPVANEAAPGVSETVMPEATGPEGMAQATTEPYDVLLPPSEAQPTPGAALLHAGAAAVPPPYEMAAAPPVQGPTFADRLTVWKDEFIAWFKTLASAAVYATLIVTFGFQVARVEGLSMAPTLEDQDRLIVNKFIYRVSSPRKGDIVMLYYPVNPDKSFVKRVIGEEGDQVRIVDGKVFVNDVPMPDEFVIPEYRSHDEYGPTVVPEGYYFVMGDHRNNSSDSRHWGMVPKKYIIGRVQLRWWPIPTARVF